MRDDVKVESLLTIDLNCAKSLILTDELLAKVFGIPLNRFGTPP